MNPPLAAVHNGDDMARGAGHRRLDDERGQLAPALMLLFVVFVAGGVLLFQVGAAGVLRSDAQTAADAAALAAAQDLQRQMVRLLLDTGWNEAAALDHVSATRAARDYAARNDAIVTSIAFEQLTVTVEVVGDHEQRVDGPGSLEEVDDVAAEARAVASVDVVYAPGVPGGVGGGPLTGGGSCPVPRDVIERVAADAGVEPERALAGSFLTRYAGCGNAPGVSVSGLALPMQVALLRVEQAMGAPLQLTSGFRTAAYQAQLCARVTGPCAPPGRSMHQFGLAVDVGNWQAVVAVLRADPSIPLCQPLPSNDAVHISHALGRECGGRTGTLGSGQAFGGDPASFATFAVRLVE